MREFPRMGSALASHQSSASVGAASEQRCGGRRFTTVLCGDCRLERILCHTRVRSALKGHGMSNRGLGGRARAEAEDD